MERTNSLTATKISSNKVTLKKSAMSTLTFTVLLKAKNSKDVIIS